MVSQQHCCCAFQSTLPAGERQSSSLLCVVLHYISTHAPRMGSDIDPDILQTSENNFNPRSPHRERLPRIGGQIPGHRFQSTLPVGGATEPQFIIDSYIEIFQSTLSVGGRPKKIHNRGDDSGFQSTLPTWGATDIGKRADTVRNISIHAPRMGSDVGSSRMFSLADNFNPRSPHGERHSLL